MAYYISHFTAETWREIRENASYGHSGHREGARNRAKVKPDVDPPRWGLIVRKSLHEIPDADGDWIIGRLEATEPKLGQGLKKPLHHRCRFISFDTLESELAQLGAKVQMLNPERFLNEISEAAP